ncbi:arginine--tRNA ligase [Candidatus Omnitrophota bacterium]
MTKQIQDIILAAISDSLKGMDLEEVLRDGIILDLTKEVRFGDLSTNIAMKLASFLKKPPRDIANKLITGIKEYLKKNRLQAYIKDIKLEGAGFINFYLSEKYFFEQLSELVKGQELIMPDLGKGRKVLIEFVSANPTGPLSVAHARQAAVGDVLANILAFLGFKVKREYYLNDEGNQIDILGRSIIARMKELSGKSSNFEENFYQGKYIYAIAQKAIDNNIKEEDVAEYGVEYILKVIKTELEDFGVTFDSWFSQKSLSKSEKTKKALELLKKRGYLFEEDGATWFKSTEFGDDKDRVVIKSDGAYTYITPDLAYHQDKYKRGFDWLINLWGPDHHGYVNRLKAGVQALGHEAKSISIIIVQLAAIYRAGVLLQMSTRRGQYITLREVLTEVGRDAARFFFLMRRTSSHLDFDLDVAKKQTSDNPVYYVQYAHARICSILNNKTAGVKFRQADLSLLKEKEELALLKKVWQFSFVLQACLSTTDPYLITTYLQEVAERFHRFYDLHRVLGVDQDLSRARLALIEGARITLAKGLELLGISRPEKM